MSETYEKIIGMKVVDGKIQFITSMETLPDDATEAQREAMIRAQDLARGTFTVPQEKK